MQKAGFRSVRAFYQEQSFSFSYEYLRQILDGKKVPSPEKVEELAQGLGVDVGKLQRLAFESKLDQKVKKHYQFAPKSKSGNIEEKKAHYQRESRKEERLIQKIQELDEKEKEQVANYIKFLKQQRRKKQ